MQRLTLPLLLVLACTLLTAGCSNKKKDNRDMTSAANELMSKGDKSLKAGNWTTAIQAYETLEARFPFANETKQAQLNLIYAYYSNAQPEAAIEATEQFERENPTHPRMDYALYMRGVVQFKGEKNMTHRYLGVDVSRRPPVNAEESFIAFQQLVRRFPESKYTPDARQRMLFLRNRLAEHQNHIVQYYYDRGAYTAAVNRASLTMQRFNGAPELEKTLILLAKSYRKLGMQKHADDALTVLNTNYPNASLSELKDPWYKVW